MKITYMYMCVYICNQFVRLFQVNQKKSHVMLVDHFVCVHNCISPYVWENMDTWWLWSVYIVATNAFVYMEPRHVYY